MRTPVSTKDLSFPLVSSEGLDAESTTPRLLGEEEKAVARAEPGSKPQPLETEASVTLGIKKMY